MVTGSSAGISAVSVSGGVLAGFPQIADTIVVLVSKVGMGTTVVTDTIAVFVAYLAAARAVVITIVADSVSIGIHIVARVGAVFDSGIV